MATVNPTHITKLGEKNYETWKIKVRGLLIYDDLWPYTSGEELKTEENAAAWTRKDQKALTLILLTVEDSQLNHIKRAETSMEAWRKLEGIHESKGPIRRAALCKQLQRLKKEPRQTMTQYLGDFQHKAEQLEEVGMKVPEDLLSVMLLASLPTEYEGFTIAIESRDALPSFETLKSKLIEEEARREQGQNTEEERSNALVTKPKFNKYTKNREQPQRFKGNCHICKKYGHAAKNCRYRSHDVNTRSEAMKAAAFTSYHMEENTWVLDSGSTKHATPLKHRFSEIQDHQSKIYTATDEGADVKGSGSVEMSVKLFNAKTNNIKLEKVAFIPSFKNNLLSVSQITKKGFTVTFDARGAKVLRENGTVAMTAIERDGLYMVEDSEKQKAMLQKQENSALVKWHERLGHVNFADVKKLKSEQMVVGMNDNLNSVAPVCEICNKCKIHTLPFKASTYRSKEKLELVHSDVCGPFSVPSLGGARYFVTFIDDKTRHCYVKPIKYKSDVFGAFKDYKAYAEKLTGCNIKKLRSDNGGEYLSNEFNEFLKQEGIMRQLTVDHTPQQNGVAERANRTLIEMARCMILQGNLPISLWAEAINSAAYIRNRCPTKAQENSTPEEEWTGRKPYIGFMRKIGSKVTALTKGYKRNKFEPKGREYVLVGYSTEAKAYRLWERGTRTVVNKRDVRFVEEQETILPDEKPTKQLFEVQLKPEMVVEEGPENANVHEEVFEEEEPVDADSRTGVRARGRPRLERTGRPGRPKKIYQTKPTDQPNPATVREALEGPDQQK